MTGPESLRDTAEKEVSGVRLQWSVGFWDGPLSGMCDTEQFGRCWFECVDGIDTEPRVFALFKLTDDQQELEDAEHALWVELVGEHCDYVYVDDVPHRKANFVPATHPQWRSFYDREDTLDRSSWSATPAVGTFTL